MQGCCIYVALLKIEPGTLLGFAAATCYIEPKPNNERGRFMAAVTLPTHYRNVFAEQGYAQAEIDARIENIAGRNFIENARTKNIPEIHVQ